MSLILKCNYSGRVTVCIDVVRLLKDVRYVEDQAMVTNGTGGLHLPMANYNQ